MRFRKAGRVAEHLWYLGREETGIYVLEGREGLMIISGGMGYILPDVINQMKDFGIDAGKIGKMLILHAHFDHLGVIPYFKRTYPDMEIYASIRAWDVLKMPKAIDTINAFSRLVTEKMGDGVAFADYDLFWRGDIKGTVVSDGDCIDLGGVALQIIETPGHSSCSISAYEPTLRALFASDGGGIPFKDWSIPLGNSNFTQFQGSLAKMESLSVSFLCADHYGYVTGEEAGRFITQTIEEAEKLRKAMVLAYRQFGDVDRAASSLVEGLYGRYPDYFMPEDITEGIFRQMLRHIVKVLDGS